MPSNSSRTFHHHHHIVFTVTMTFWSTCTTCVSDFLLVYWLFNFGRCCCES